MILLLSFVETMITYGLGNRENPLVWKGQDVDVELNSKRKNRLIFGADDSKTVRRLMSSVLDKAGYPYQYFDDGKGLVEALRAGKAVTPPDLILLDVEMPVLSGFETCRYIRENFGQIGAPIIFFSAQDSATARDNGFMVGGQEFIVKPFTPPELVARLDYLIDKADNEDTGEHILYADDSKTMSKAISKILEDEGYRVDTYASGDQLLDNLAGKKPNAIILDVEMPGRNGFETCKEIRSRFSDLEVPVLFFTTESSRDNIRLARDVGGNDFISKKLKPDVLIGRVRHATKGGVNNAPIPAR